MRWVLETNRFEEDGWERLLSAVKRRGLPLTIVKTIPFGGGLSVEEGDLPGPEEKTFVMGTYTLTNYAKHLGWKPGAVLDNLNFQIQQQNWGSTMLNHDGETYEFGSVPQFSELMFMRPTHDTKAFTGRVVDWGEYSEWRDRVQKLWDDGLLLEGDLLTPDTPVVVSSKKEIYAETRTWVVPGATIHRTSLTPVVTSSQYKVGTIKRYQEQFYTDLRVLEFVDRVVSKWYPNEAFVMDVADTPDGLRVIEVNNLNSSGFYKADLGRLVESLEERFG